MPRHALIPPPPVPLEVWQWHGLERVLIRRVRWPTMAGRRVMLALLRDPLRSNRVVAAEAGVTNGAVTRIRHELEGAGIIPVYRAPDASPLPLSVRARVLELLAADPPGSRRAIARQVGCGETTVRVIRDRMEAAREICVYRFGEHQAGCWCEA